MTYALTITFTDEALYAIAWMLLGILFMRGLFFLVQRYGGAGSDLIGDLTFELYGNERERSGYSIFRTVLFTSLGLLMIPVIITFGFFPRRWIKSK